MVFELGFLQYELRHELTEHLSHGVHAGVACPHIVNLVAHGEKHGLHSPCARRVVQLGVAVGDVAHADKCQRLLHVIKCFLETVQSADAAKGEAFTFCQAVGRGEVFKKLYGIPDALRIVIHFDGYLRLISSYSLA